MALVGYSDSEDSDLEQPQPAVLKAAAKRLERSDGKKIKVDLSTLQSDAVTDQVSEPSAKRQRTGGAFSGFNSLLPAPKRAAQSSLRSGVSLRTSSEAAFSRAPQPFVQHTEISEINPRDAEDNNGDISTTIAKPDQAVTEPKLVGKTTRFLPLSVANAKKKKRPPAAGISKDADPNTTKSTTQAPEASPATQLFKPKQSLFSITEPASDVGSASEEPYQPEFVQTNSSDRRIEGGGTHDAIAASQMPQDTALNGVASDLNLSASDRRRLFGRHGNQADVKISHFDMNAEYRTNQGLAAKGEVVEHRTVRAIAPGKHSLQQLVNNVKGQTDAIEEKWAEGRRNRGETGSKYGW